MASSALRLCLCVCVCVWALVGAKPAPQDDQCDADCQQKLAKVKGWAEDCFKESGTDFEAVNKTQECAPIEDAKVKSFYGCMMRRTGLLTAEGGVDMAEWEREKGEYAAQCDKYRKAVAGGGAAHKDAAALCDNEAAIEQVLGDCLQKASGGAQQGDGGSGAAMAFRACVCDAARSKTR